MARVLLLIILFWVIYLLGKRFIRHLDKKPAPGTVPSSEKMVKCTICEAYIPESESILINQKVVCKHQPCKN